MSRSTTPNLPIFYVYVLTDGRKRGPFYYGNWKFSHEPFYVGKGKNNRWCSHFIEHNLKKRINSHKTRKMRKIQREGHNVPVKIVRHSMVEKEAFDLEVKLISRIGRHDLNTGPLTNKTNGGEGFSGHIMSRKTKKKLSIIGTNQFKNMSAEQLALRTQKAKDTVASNPVKEINRIKKITEAHSNR